MSAQPLADSPVIAFERAAVRYGRRSVVEDLSFSVSHGAVYALLGRNGTGKSSLVRCLLGQQLPSSGVARLFGHDSWKTRTAAMGRLGYVPEEPDAPPEMSARRLNRFCARLYRNWSLAEVQSRLEHFEVPLDLAFAKLSKGQKGAVMLALALGHSPELLILDDPTLGLDVIARRGFYDELLGELAARGTTVFMTTHDLAGIEAIASHVGILVQGRLVVDESLETLKGRCRRLALPPAPEPSWAPFRPALVQRQSLGVSATVMDFSEEGWSRFLAEHNGEGEALPASLEDIFIAVSANGKGATK